ncbi:MAG: TraB/GumN family protein [Erythrobacter sp.]
MLLASCGDDPAKEVTEDASPLMYEIANADGELEGWLFGTIHALPDGTSWRTAAIQSAIEDADLLVVEVASLEDEQALAATFAELSASPDLPALTARVTPSLRPQLIDLVSRSQFSVSDFGSVETWAAAIMLSQVGTQGDSENGVDRAIIGDFDERQILELEGAEDQLRIFDALPESEQRDLLSGIVREVEQLDNDPARLRRAWLSGDEQVLIDATQSGIMADAELKNALLVDRNRDWTAQIETLLQSEPQPLVAVGAAHLVGPDGLPSMLADKGFVVRAIP